MRESSSSSGRRAGTVAASSVCYSRSRRAKLSRHVTFLPFLFAASSVAPHFACHCFQRRRRARVSDDRVATSQRIGKSSSTSRSNRQQRPLACLSLRPAVLRPQAAGSPLLPFVMRSSSTFSAAGPRSTTAARRFSSLRPAILCLGLLRSLRCQVHRPVQARVQVNLVCAAMTPARDEDSDGCRCFQSLTFHRHALRNLRWAPFSVPAHALQFVPARFPNLSVSDPYSAVLTPLAAATHGPYFPLLHSHLAHPAQVPSRVARLRSLQAVRPPPSAIVAARERAQKVEMVKRLKRLSDELGREGEVVGREAEKIKRSLGGAASEGEKLAMGIALVRN